MIHTGTNWLTCELQALADVALWPVPFVFFSSIFVLTLEERKKNQHQTGIWPSVWNFQMASGPVMVYPPSSTHKRSLMYPDMTDSNYGMAISLMCPEPSQHTVLYTDQLFGKVCKSSFKFESSQMIIWGGVLLLKNRAVIHMSRNLACFLNLKILSGLR